MLQNLPILSAAGIAAKANERTTAIPEARRLEHSGASASTSMAYARPARRGNQRGQTMINKLQPDLPREHRSETNLLINIARQAALSAAETLQKHLNADEIIVDSDEWQDVYSAAEDLETALDSIYRIKKL